MASGLPENRGSTDGGKADIGGRPSDAADRRQIEAWIVEAKQGSTAAIGHLLDASRDYLCRVANQRLSQPVKLKVSASDLVQETSLDAHRDFANFQGTALEELLAWLRGILVCNAANAYRRYEATAKRRVSREIPLELYPALAEDLHDGAESPRSLLVASEERQRVEAALGRLSEDHRTAIVLRSREHYSFLEIGQFMNRSAEAARKLWFRAVEQLQRELSENDDGLSGS